MRVDFQLMPGVTYETIAFPAFSALQREQQPTVILPDSEVCDDRVTIV